MDNRMTVINEAVQYLEGRLGGLRPQIGIILGSGLGNWAAVWANWRTGSGLL